MFITKKWIFLAPATNVASEPFWSRILKLPPAIVLVYAIKLESVVSLPSAKDCTCNKITESACTEVLVTTIVSSPAAAKVSEFKVITPLVVFIPLVILVLKSEPLCVTVPIPVCTIPFAAVVITKLPTLTVTSGSVTPPVTVKDCTSSPLPLDTKFLIDPAVPEPASSPPYKFKSPALWLPAVDDPPFKSKSPPVEFEALPPSIVTFDQQN